MVDPGCLKQAKSKWGKASLRESHLMEERVWHKYPDSTAGSKHLKTATWAGNMTIAVTWNFSDPSALWWECFPGQNGYVNKQSSLTKFCDIFGPPCCEDNPPSPTKASHGGEKFSLSFHNRLSSNRAIIRLNASEVSVINRDGCPKAGGDITDLWHSYHYPQHGRGQ